MIDSTGRKKKAPIQKKRRPRNAADPQRKDRTQNESARGDSLAGNKSNKKRRAQNQQVKRGTQMKKAKNVIHKKRSPILTFVFNIVFYAFIIVLVGGSILIGMSKKVLLQSFKMNKLFLEL